MNNEPVSVVLVEPSIAENVGFVARTMACFGLSRLDMVGEKRFDQNPAALTTATSAVSVLQSAKYHNTLTSAIHDAHWVLAFTRRPRDLAMRVWDWPQPLSLIQSGQKVALVFGRESQGLSTDECQLATHVIRLPLPHPSLSLNLSHAVSVVLSELFFHYRNLLQKEVSESQNSLNSCDLADGFELPNQNEKYQRFSMSQREEQFLQLCEFLAERGYLYTDKAKLKAQLEHLRLLWQRLDPDKMDRDFLLGIFARALQKKPN